MPNTANLRSFDVLIFESGGKDKLKCFDCVYRELDRKIDLKFGATVKGAVERELLLIFCVIWVIELVFPQAK